LVSGISQFLLCAALGIGLAMAMGYAPGKGNFDWLYIAVTLSLSSTLIVVKLLYDKSELTTLPGRITLGVLVFQDIWAIVFLALQPSLHDPRVSMLLQSFVKGGGLVLLTLGVSRYALPRFFSFVAKVPELMLIAALAWCFLVSGAADALGLSREMGALIAGVSMSTFPYNIDVIAKVTNIRDFLRYLVFRRPGHEDSATDPHHRHRAVGMSLLFSPAGSSRFFPVLYLLGNGFARQPDPVDQSRADERVLSRHRFPGIGAQPHHCGVGWTLYVSFRDHFGPVHLSDRLQSRHPAAAGHAASEIRFASGADSTGDAAEPEEESAIVFLGCFREASSILHEIEAASQRADGDDRAAPAVGDRLQSRNFSRTQESGDQMSLRRRRPHGHAAPRSHSLGAGRRVHDLGRDSAGNHQSTLLRQARRLCPNAQVIAAADTISSALDLYEQAPISCMSRGCTRPGTWPNGSPPPLHTRTDSRTAAKTRFNL
jgi:hypothetical protein